jgi:hypothetical protein
LCFTGFFACQSAQQTTLPVFNTAIEVWFSEAVVSASIAATGPTDVEPLATANARVQLQLDGVVVDGSVICVHIGHEAGCQRVRFVAAAPLQPGADYRLVLQQGLKGISGAGLAQTVSLPFPAQTLPQGNGPAQLSVVSFEMLELSRSDDYSDSPYYFYAPQLRVAERAGLSAAYIIRARFEMPGGWGQMGAACSHAVVAAGGSSELFPEAYGDLSLSFSSGDGLRALAGEAKATIVYGDYRGAVDSLTVSGPIVPGSLPTTYTATDGTWYFGPNCSAR